MEETLPSAFVKIHTSRVHRLWAALVATHPVYELCLCDIHVTAAKRAKIMMDCVLGSLSFVALFFSVDGSAVAASSPAECPIEQGSFLWYTFVALFSVLLNLAPRSLEFHLAWRSFVQAEQGKSGRRRWHEWRRCLKDVAFWMFSICLSLLHLLVVTAFLANLSEADEFKWMFAFAVVLLRKLVIVPLLTCLFSSLGTELICTRGPVLPPKKLGLDLQQLDLAKPGATCDARDARDARDGRGQEDPEGAGGDPGELWREKVRELAGRGLTIRQLLDFYAGLGRGNMKHFDPGQSTTHDVPCPKPRGARV